MTIDTMQSISITLIAFGLIFNWVVVQRLIKVQRRMLETQRHLLETNDELMRFLRR